MEVVTQTLSDIKPKAKEHNIVLSIAKNINNATVYGNFGQLQEIILRIIDNAFLAITLRPSQTPSGVISIQIDQVKLNRQPFVKVQISDNGIGMSPDQIQQLFEPFYTEWFGETKHHIGLSLAIVHIILQNHNGHITVKSNQLPPSTKLKEKQKQGTTIILEFPMI